MLPIVRRQKITLIISLMLCACSIWIGGCVPLIGKEFKPKPRPGFAGIRQLLEETSDVAALEFRMDAAFFQRGILQLLTDRDCGYAIKVGYWSWLPLKAIAAACRHWRLVAPGVTGHETELVIPQWHDRGGHCGLRAVRILADPERFAPAARAHVTAAGHDLLLSGASVWEIAVKHALGRLRLPMASAETCRVAGGDAPAALPIQQAHALRVGQLPPHHRNPFDLLIAQAQAEGLTTSG